MNYYYMIIQLNITDYKTEAPICNNFPRSDWKDLTVSSIVPSSCLNKTSVGDGFWRINFYGASVKNIHKHLASKLFLGFMLIKKRFIWRYSGIELKMYLLS